jgi:hypothetical protein
MLGIIGIPISIIISIIGMILEVRGEVVLGEIISWLGIRCGSVRGIILSGIIL